MNKVSIKLVVDGCHGIEKEAERFYCVAAADRDLAGPRESLSSDNAGPVRSGANDAAPSESTHLPANERTHVQVRHYPR